MSKYIDADRLRLEIEKTYKSEIAPWLSGVSAKSAIYDYVMPLIDSLQQEQPAMIQWTGNNLKEVIDFTGKSPRFEEWFKSWEEFETYVHQHNDILKLFCEDGSHYEVPVGAWIVKTPDGYNLPSVAKYIQQEQPKMDWEKEIDKFLNETGAPYVWCNDDEQKEWCNIIARHFWNKGYNARKKEHPKSLVDTNKTLDGLMEDVRRYYSENFDYITSDQPTLSILTNVARHFFELGLNSRKEK